VLWERMRHSQARKASFAALAPGAREVSAAILPTVAQSTPPPRLLVIDAAPHIIAITNNNRNTRRRSRHGSVFKILQVRSLFSICPFPFVALLRKFAATTLVRV
jgi:hypothetical protein